jgi:Ca2+:H+ antiporter
MLSSMAVESTRSSWESHCFALVPNTTEFMNAMSFAINGNISLRYVDLPSFLYPSINHCELMRLNLRPAWKLARPTHCRSASSRSPLWWPLARGTIPGIWAPDTFTLIFPWWDVIAILLSIFLLTYTYIEAKSNYHRGRILILHRTVARRTTRRWVGGSEALQVEVRRGCHFGIWLGYCFGHC